MYHPHLISKVRHIRLLSKPLGLLLFLLLISFINTARGASAFVWSQYEPPHINVYYSPDGKSKVQLTSSGTNVLAILDRHNNETWVAWVGKNALHDDRLHYARLTPAGIILETGSVAETAGGLYAPSIAIEPPGNRVWMVWAENHGRTEDLLVSYLETNKTTLSNWAPPIQITANDQFSANVPHIERAESGAIEISWSHTGPDRSQRARATVSTRLFEGNSTSSRQLKPVATEYENANAGHARIKYITSRTDQSQDTRSWKRLTQNNTPLMGAMISDSGIVTRVFDKRK